jgi:hypothetical protein
MSPIFGGDFEQNHGLRGCDCRADRSASFRGHGKEENSAAACTRACL